jgi:Flp pilus assembly protein TadD
MEYLKQNNFKLALHQFEIAKDICQTDPNIYNEIGTAHYKQGNYKEA